jgi:hypothetical protein
MRARIDMFGVRATLRCLLCRHETVRRAGKMAKARLGSRPAGLLAGSCRSHRGIAPVISGLSRPANQQFFEGNGSVSAVSGCELSQ